MRNKMQKLNLFSNKVILRFIWMRHFQKILKTHHLIIRDINFFAIKMNFFFMDSFESTLKCKFIPMDHLKELLYKYLWIFLESKILIVIFWMLLNTMTIKIRLYQSYNDRISVIVIKIYTDRGQLENSLFKFLNS